MTISKEYIKLLEEIVLTMPANYITEKPKQSDTVAQHKYAFWLVEQ